MKRAALYMGRRFENGKLVQLFQRGGGKVIRFRGITGCIIGYFYELKSDTQMARRPNLLTPDTRARPEFIEEWTLEDEVARAEAGADRMRRQLQSKVIPLSELQVLRRLCAGASLEETEKIITYIVGEIVYGSRNAKKKRRKR